jgi:hypothetical protein
MWQLIWDIVFWTINIVNVLFMVLIVAEPMLDLYKWAIKKFKAYRYRSSLVSESVPKSKRNRK